MSRPIKHPRPDVSNSIPELGGKRQPFCGCNIMTAIVDNIRAPSIEPTELPEQVVAGFGSRPNQGSVRKCQVRLNPRCLSRNRALPPPPHSGRLNEPR